MFCLSTQLSGPFYQAKARCLMHIEVSTMAPAFEKSKKALLPS